jgi:flagellar operon protein
MAINNLAGAIAAGANSVKPADATGKVTSGSPSNMPGSEVAADFKNALGEALAKTVPSNGSATTKLGQIAAQMPEGGARIAPGSTLKFSNHSLERMHSRGITYSPEQMKSIEGAVAKAAAKGSKDTLVLTDNSALIVSVKNGTVVTVMDRQTMKENVFTNIDSTVMA